MIIMKMTRAVRKEAYESEASCFADGDIKQFNHHGKQLDVPQKGKYRVTRDLVNLRHVSEE